MSFHESMMQVHVHHAAAPVAVIMCMHRFLPLLQISVPCGQWLREDYLCSIRVELPHTSGNIHD